MKKQWEKFRALAWWKQTLAWIAAPFVALFIAAFIAAIVDPPEDDDDGGGEKATATRTATQATTTTTATAEITASIPTTTTETGPTDDDLKAALDDADPSNYGAVSTDLKVKNVERTSLLVTVNAETPEGGLDGASVDDIDGSAAAAFEAVYNDAGWRGATFVVFTGGLVDTRTGEELPDARTGAYRVDAKEGQGINWDNADIIDWSLYRTYASPALKD